MRANIVLRVVAMIGIIGLLVPVAQAGLGSGGGAPPGSTTGAFTAPMECRVIGGQNLDEAVQIQDIYGVRVVQVNNGRLICTQMIPAGTSNFLLGTVPSANALKCYQVTSVKTQSGTPSDSASFTDDPFDIAEVVPVGDPRYLCVPAVVPPSP